MLASHVTVVALTVSTAIPLDALAQAKLALQ